MIFKRSCFTAFFYFYRMMNKKKAIEHFENNADFEGLKVNRGIQEPDKIHSASVENFRRSRRRVLSAESYFEGIRSGNRTILSQAITLIESSLPEHQEIARQVVALCLPFTGQSVRIGITGVPGVGKSTFIESIGNYICNQDHSIAVLAVDPSSEISGGSILGDKTRMETLVNHPKVYIRPSPSSGSLGGVARKTRETIYLCEAAGFDVVLIETVGVGQSETAVHSMVDFFLLLMLGGAGDELQGIKRGIMEMADAIAITKSDGDNVLKTKIAKAEYENALHLFPAAASGWIPRVSVCSALNHNGMDEIWNSIHEYVQLTRTNGYFHKKRIDQSRYWMYESVEQRIREAFFQHSDIKNLLPDLENKLANHQMSSFEAADLLLATYLKSAKQ